MKVYEAIEKRSNEQPLVSVVVTTKNEAKNIRNCLESIKLQSWKNLEIILVDNFSTDGTVNIGREYTNKIYLMGPERSAQRNFGMIEKSQGYYVMYIDADMLLSPRLVELCVVFAQENAVHALYISEIVLGKNYFSRVRRFERMFYDGTPVDGARFFNRKSFISVGGFDEKLFAQGSGEDWDIDKSIRRFGAIGTLPRNAKEISGVAWPMANFLVDRGVTHSTKFSGIYHNEAEFNLIRYLKKKYYYSSGFGGYINKWGKNDPDIKRQFSFGYRYFGVFTENGKWKALLLRPDLVVGLYFIRFLVGVIFLTRRLQDKKRSE